MHELGLLRGVVTAVDEALEHKASGQHPQEKTERRAIEAVGLTVGTQSGVLPEALDGAWPFAIAGTSCEGARLDVTIVPATVYCPSCACEQEIDEYFALTCPVCGTPTADLRHGREFQLTYVDLAD